MHYLAIYSLIFYTRVPWVTGLWPSILTTIAQKALQAPDTPTVCNSSQGQYTITNKPCSAPGLGLAYQGASLDVLGVWGVVSFQAPKMLRKPLSHINLSSHMSVLSFDLFYVFKSNQTSFIEHFYCASSKCFTKKHNHI